MASTSTIPLDNLKDSDEVSDTGSEELENEHMALMSRIGEKLKPDPITGDIDDSDMIEYFDTHKNDPDVRAFWKNSKKRNAHLAVKRAQAAANFDPSTLNIQLRAAWLVTLDYAGLTTDERTDDDWDVDGDGSKRKQREEERKQPSKQIFQIFCYIREGPDAYGGGSDARYTHEYIGLPTSQQVEDFIKICMTVPIGNWKPCIPQQLYIAHNLKLHEAALTPFLRKFPFPFVYFFESDEIYDRVRQKDFEEAEAMFRKKITYATTLKDQGNKAFQRGDRQLAVAKFQEAGKDLDRLLLKKLSEEKERDTETRTLLAVCMGNCSAARMLVVGGERDIQGAVEDAERAIKADPAYAKAYVRLFRAHEALGDLFEAKNALVRGLKRKELENHAALAEHLISLQTEGKGLESLSSLADFDAWLHRVLVEDEKSAQMMKDVGGVWKKRCDDRRNEL